MIQILGIGMIVCWFFGLISYIIALKVGGADPLDTRANRIGDVLMGMSAVFAVAVVVVGEFR